MKLYGYCMTDTDRVAKLTAPVENELFSSPPLTISERDLFLKFRTSPKRAELLDSLKQTFEIVRGHVDIDCMMLGGSFLNTNNNNPKDIDAIIFYEKKQNCEVEIGDTLSNLIKDSKLNNIDIRFVPTDSHKWILVKLTSFFTALYLSQKGSNDIKKNEILIVVPN